MVDATIRGVGDALIRKTSPVVRSRREGVGLELFRRALCPAVRSIDVNLNDA
jgi:hypothetical protein